MLPTLKLKKLWVGNVVAHHCDETKKNLTNNCQPGFFQTQEKTRTLRLEEDNHKNAFQPYSVGWKAIVNYLTSIVETWCFSSVIYISVNEKVAKTKKE